MALAGHPGPQVARIITELANSDMAGLGNFEQDIAPAGRRPNPQAEQLPADPWPVDDGHMAVIARIEADLHGDQYKANRPVSD